MRGEFAHADTKDVKPLSTEGFHNIKPEKEMSAKELSNAVKEEFRKAAGEASLNRGVETSQKEFSKNDVNELPNVVQNKLDGCRRENEVEEELNKKYPESEGYKIIKEAYLRDSNGNFVVDPVTGEKRRVDFMVVKAGKVVDSIEVTSLTAPKEEQLAKEARIRADGGNYIRDNDSNLAQMPADIHTRVERRD